MGEKHLWEVVHPYYCAEQNYRARGDECGQYYDSFEEFLKDWSIEDDEADYNLLFRWDWLDADKENEDFKDEADKYDSDLLKIFWIMQRLGDYRYCIIKVKKEEEDKVIKFLKPRWEYMNSLWSPFF